MSTVATITLFFAAVYWLFKPRERADPAPRLQRCFPKPYPATSIVHNADACTAVKALEGTRFLAWEAPSIPVSGCGTDQCQCRYIYHADRRASGSDRRSHDPENPVDPSFDRRRGNDRRATRQGQRASAESNRIGHIA